MSPLSEVTQVPDTALSLRLALRCFEEQIECLEQTRLPSVGSVSRLFSRKGDVLFHSLSLMLAWEVLIKEMYFEWEIRNNICPHLPYW